MAQAVNRISALTVRGFKSLATEQHIEIRPLTILAGSNSSGKSSIMQPLLLLKQTLEAPVDPGALLLDGEHVKFTEADQLLCRCHGAASSQSFHVGMRLRSDDTLSLAFRRVPSRGFDVTELVSELRGDRVRIAPDMTHDAIRELLPELWKHFDSNLGEDTKRRLEWTVGRDRCFLAFDLRSDDESGKKVQFGIRGTSPSVEFESYILGILHLPGLRGNPRRTYAKTAVTSRFPGTFEPYTASVIAAWRDERSDKIRELGRMLETLGLTWKVDSIRIDDTRVELKVGRLPHAVRGGAQDLVSIADVGFGVSQTLPVLVSLLVARPGQLVYLEQPEIHLHPLAQRRMARILADAAKSGVVVVAETHSSLLLREIQTLVATGAIDPGDVAFHWFERDKNGCTAISTTEPDENGAYGDWPVDFDRVELEAERDYLDAVENRESAR